MTTQEQRIAHYIKAIEGTSNWLEDVKKIVIRDTIFIR